MKIFLRSWWPTCSLSSSLEQSSSYWAHELETWLKVKIHIIPNKEEVTCPALSIILMLVYFNSSQKKIELVISQSFCQCLRFGLCVSWRVWNLEETAAIGYWAVERHARPLALIERGLHLAHPSKPIHLSLRGRPQQNLERSSKRRRALLQRFRFQKVTTLSGSCG